jgi:hypothetical protein
MTEEQKAGARDLMTKVAIACRDYDPQVVMTVLELAMLEEVSIADENVGKLFEEMMKEFRREAALILGVNMLIKAVKAAKEAQDIDGTEKVS